MLLRQQLSDVTRQLRDAGVASILLKGAAYLAAGLFHDAAIREMADLDVLIDPANLPAAAAALESLGYRRQDRPFGIEQHDVLFISSTGVAPVELHRAIGVPAVAQLLTWDRIWRRSEAIEVGGSPTHILGPTDAMIHHVLHAQIQDYDHVYFGVPLRQLHTSLLLGRAWAGRLDEEEVIGRFTAARLQAPLLGHLDLVRRIFHEEPMERLSIPREDSGAHHRQPRVLRTPMADRSGANIAGASTWNTSRHDMAPPTGEDSGLGC